MDKDAYMYSTKQKKNKITVATLSHSKHGNNKTYIMLGLSYIFLCFLSNQTCNGIHNSL